MKDEHPVRERRESYAKNAKGIQNFFFIFSKRPHHLFKMSFLYWFSFSRLSRNFRAFRATETGIQYL